MGDGRGGCECPLSGAGLCASVLYSLRGRQKQNRRTPPVHGIFSIPDPPTHQPPAKMFCLFFLVRFWAFLGKGSSKTPLKYFGKKSMSKTFPQKIEKKSMSVFSRLFFVLSRFRVFFNEWSSKTLEKKSKSRVEKYKT
jgi:hypothetical protein